MTKLIAYECEDTDHGSCCTTHSEATASKSLFYCMVSTANYCEYCIVHLLSNTLCYKIQHPMNVRVTAHHENVIKIGVHKMGPNHIVAKMLLEK